MNKHHFHTLLSRYRSGDCTEQERRLVEHWFALIDGGAADHSYQENQQTEDRLWNAIQGRTQPASSLKGKVMPFLLNWRWAAAAVFFFMVWGGYHFNRKRADRVDEERAAGRFPQGLITKTNNSAVPVRISLADGSEISLSPKGSIQYPTTFSDGRREVFLKGKAFFKVAKNPEKPFFVYTGAIATQVLGTSFWVDIADSSNAVEVSVVTGKVSVFQRNEHDDVIAGETKNGVVLSPNQRVMYTHENQSFVTSLVDEPVMQQSYAGRFVFDDVPLTQVLEALEKAYGIEIVLENERFKNCLFTADINRQPMFTKLDLISAAVNARYEVKGTRILLSGKGCSAH
ncbi:FecR family protein [Dyadobacter bucti]|uniref:FecR family protein n=1 Tax=Dyadobacter bucti TaxID=2572203 RepID=UPI0011089E61|nr:FecR family protein [Dyadobacter bucti]